MGAVTSAAGGYVGSGLKHKTKDQEHRGNEKRRREGGHGRSGTGCIGIVIHWPVLFKLNVVLERYGVVCWEWCGEENEGGVPIIFNPLLMETRSQVAEHLGGMMLSSMSKLSRMLMFASSASFSSINNSSINCNKHGDRGVRPLKTGKVRMDERARKALVHLLMQRDVKLKRSSEQIVQEYAQECNKLGVSMQAKIFIMYMINKMAFIKNRGTDRGVGHVKKITY